MFISDRIRGYRGASRVLKPGGRFIFNVWDRIEENVFANDVTNALAEFFPQNSRFLARTPHGYNDVGAICGELEQAGFTEVTVETRTELSRAASARHPAIAFCQGTPLRNEIEAFGGDYLDQATEHAAAAIASHHGQGEVAAKIQALVITAT